MKKCDCSTNSGKNRFYCSIKNPDGSVFWGDTREILKSVVNKFSQKGYTCMIGAECEFYLFKTDENGEPTTKPFDNGGYLDVSPLDKGENVRREICLCLEEMGIRPETSHHEQGPGQNEIDFKFSDAVNSADNLITFKQVVRSIAARNGLFASFAPKPLPGKSGSGLHINISLMKNGQNIFRLGEKEDSKIPESFVAGVLQKITEITAFLNPIPNSYERLGYFEAPKYVSWSYGNRSQLVRIPAAQKDRRRMELRSPDPATNPYLAFALVIGAGMYGIENNLELPESINVDLYSADESITGKLPRLPENLEEALRLAEKSDLVRSILNERVIERFVELKTKELKEYDRAEDKYGHFIENYFRVI
ncbi:glutamine synthetase family protein [Thermoclostridium stercorarium]|uniref:glutamine synthetase family protein n=1 Tax=Thermoclostridium stercorarium TaxID=1510 RepID=UPI000BAC2A43|nr:glutamine synthetase [Thermoclostridium stercorarium]